MDQADIIFIMNKIKQIECMKDKLQKMNVIDMEDLFIKMALIIQDNLRMDIEMDSDNIILKMGTIMKDNIFRIKEKDRVNIYLYHSVNIILDFGKMTNMKVKEFYTRKMEIFYSKVNG